MRQFLIILLVFSMGCLTPRGKELRETVFQPLGVDLFFVVTPYIEAGLQVAVLEGKLTQTQADLLVVQMAAIQKGLESGDLDKVKDANWRTLEEWAVYAVEKRVLDKTLSPLEATLLFRQIANFEAWLNDMSTATEIGYYLRRSTGSKSMYAADILVGDKPLYIGRAVPVSMSQGE